MNPRYALIAAAMMHMEGAYSVKTLAFRNNNPGNIENPDGTFKVFDSKLAGFMALLLDIQSNQGKTLAAFLSKYAPPNENNTNNYISVVSTITGVQPDETL